MGVVVLKLTGHLHDWDSKKNSSLDHSLVLINSVQPVYPSLAKRARVEGKVRLAAMIGPDGHVKQVTLIDGNPLLVPAAMDAAKEWVFSPPTANGQPVTVKNELDVNFRLDSPEPR